MKLLTLLIASILAGIAYRLGGWNKGNRLYRILGVSAISCITLYILLHEFYFIPYFLTFGLTAGAVSAYWGLDEKRFGYWAHGLGLSLAVLPIAIITQHWIGFSIRCLVLTALITLWSEYTKWDVGEEFGRGAVIIGTLPLLLF